MTVADLLPVAPGDLSIQSDPVAYMALVLNRAKGWLDEAQNVDTAREAKAIAVGYEAVIHEKELAFDAQLAATRDRAPLRAPHRAAGPSRTGPWRFCR